MSKEIVRLMAGFRRFKDKYFLADDNKDSIYQRLATSGQTPKTLLIGCSDSRVDPAILTDASPGEIFVVRNVANLIPPWETPTAGFHGTSSALEFAVEGLKVENIIVLGHRQCGGIKALMDGATDRGDSFIGRWMSIAESARQKVLKDHPKADEVARWRFAEMESLKVSLRNVHSFPFVQKAIAERQLNVMGIYFDLEQGELWEYDEGAEEFRQLVL